MSKNEKENLLRQNAYSNDLNSTKQHTDIKDSILIQANAEERIPILNKTDNNNNTDYSSVAKSNVSIEINDSTTIFDLWKGLFYMFLSCIFKSLFSVLSKYSLKDKADLSSFQLLSYRTYFMLWITVLLVSLLPVNVFSEKFVSKDKLPQVFLRTIFAIVSMSLVVYSIKFMHISDVYSIYYIYPAFIIMLSLFFLQKETLGRLDYFCLAACFIGAILIVKPEFIFHSNNSSSRMAFFGMVLVAGMLKALEDVLVRNVGREAHYLSFPFMYSVFGMILFPIPMVYYDKVYPSFTFGEVCVIFLIAVCTFLYQTFMALGLQNESASRVSMVNYIQVALMFVSDLTIFGKAFNWLDLIGTLFIFGFNFANGFYKAHQRWKVLNNYKQNTQS